MSAQKPVFRIVRNGYDRFSVDDAVDRYAAQAEQQEKKISALQQQLAETGRQLDELKKQTESLRKNAAAEKKANENIARLSLHEANDIIATAHQNADDIIKDALATAQAVLSDLSSLYGEADKAKNNMRSQLEDLLKQIDAFRLPQMPDAEWLKEAEKKLH